EVCDCEALHVIVIFRGQVTWGGERSATLSPEDHQLSASRDHDIGVAVAVQIGYHQMICDRRLQMYHLRFHEDRAALSQVHVHRACQRIGEVALEGCYIKQSVMIEVPEIE